MNEQKEPVPSNQPERNPAESVIVGPIFVSPLEAECGNGEWLAARPSRLIAKRIEEELVLRSIDPASVVLIGRSEVAEELLRFQQAKDDFARAMDGDEAATQTEIDAAFGTIDDSNTRQRLYPDEDDEGPLNRSDWHPTADEEDDKPEAYEDDEAFELRLAELYRYVQREKGIRVPGGDDEDEDDSPFYHVDVASLADLQVVHDDYDSYPPGDEVISREVTPMYDGTILVIDKNKFRNDPTGSEARIDSGYLMFNTEEEVLDAVVLEVDAVIVNARDHGLNDDEKREAVDALQGLADTYQGQLESLGAQIVALPALSRDRILLLLRSKALSQQLEGVRAEIAAWVQ